MICRDGGIGRRKGLDQTLYGEMMMRKEEKFCIDCGKQGVKERRRCEDCVKEFNRIRAKKRNKECGRYHTIGICLVCNKSMKKWRDNQLFHTKCYNKFKSSNKQDDNISAIGRYYARKTAISLGIVMNNNCVHHIDENPHNNNVDNLIVMSIDDHSRLHNFLWQNRSLWLKDQSKYSENCWEALRDHLTTAWLETTSAKVIKLNDIGQSASEPLRHDECYEEGSEAMHGSPKS